VEVMMRGVLGLAVVAATAACATGSSRAGEPVAAVQSAPSPAGPLLSESRTVVGEDLVYPTSGKPVVTAAIVTLKPGESTPIHRHGVPMFAYILEGTLTVDYGKFGRKTYTAGQSLVEAMEVEHAGTNTGSGIVRILAVYMGADGSSNVLAQ
jgi:quercetin dioxygenase-like cupin family protein